MMLLVIIAILSSSILVKTTTQTSTVLPLVTSETFLQCISDQKCGLINKCSFKLYPSTSPTTTLSPPIGTNTTAHGANTPTNSVVVSGHIMTLKNHMPFGIVFYWDVLGYEYNDIDVNTSITSSSNRYHGVYAPPNSIKYIDTKHYLAHTIRLYVPLIFPSTGQNNPPPFADDEFPQPDPRTLENVQTVIPSGDECTRYQVCRLLDTICYMASMSNVHCAKYRTVCNNFNDADQVARDACIPECVYTYYSDVIQDFEEIDSDLVIKWISMGGGIVGSEVDGLYNTGPIIGFTIALIISILINCTFVCLACTYRDSLKSIDLKHPSGGGGGGGKLNDSDDGDSRFFTTNSNKNNNNIHSGSQSAGVYDPNDISYI